MVGLSVLMRSFSCFSAILSGTIPTKARMITANITTYISILPDPKLNGLDATAIAIANEPPTNTTMKNNLSKKIEYLVI